MKVERGAPYSYTLFGKTTNKRTEHKKAVSYTHLDVYKRQIKSSDISKIEIVVTFDCCRYSFYDSTFIFLSHNVSVNFD